MVDDLGQRIVRGEFTPDSTLPNESDLSASLDVSRTVLREAIKVLAAKGLVEARPKVGTRVLPRSHWQLIDPDVLGWQLRHNPGEAFYRDIGEIRRLIEPPAARYAALRRTEGDIDRLRSLVTELGQATDDVARYVRTDLALHAAILWATHNDLLARMTSTIDIALQAARVITTKVPGGTIFAMPQHGLVIDAIVAGDGERAERTMLDLVSGAARDVEWVLGTVTIDRDIPSTKGTSE